jgi:hypothetical protein
MRWLAIISLCVMSWRATAHAEDSEEPPPRTLSPWLAGGVWVAAQLIPSPLLVLGSVGPRGGVRWQVTPLVYSFGVAAKPVRTFVIEPVARHTGAVELYFSPEWVCCAARDKSSWLARAGARVYLPLSLSGEAGSISIGGSYAFANGSGGAAGIAGEIGLYTLSSILGLTLTIAPRLAGRELIVALTLHYF